MIIKSFELNKINFKSKYFFLLYGVNQGHKNQIIEEKFKKSLSKSFFETEKLIIVNRVTDKIKNIVEEIIDKKINDLILVLNANTLEKKSKLRSLFEKNNETICIPFYEDNKQTLSGIVSNFFRNNKIPISQQAMNLIVERCRGDRQNLFNELQKIEGYIKNKKKIDIEDLVKLTNLAENYNVSELVDSCLAKNKKKTINILNENNYSLEDCIIIIRTFLIKAKRLLKLSRASKNQKNIEEVISSFKPPIFWKDKDIVKKQMQNWPYNKAENLIYKVNEIELLIKKNSTNSINILSDFIIEQSTISNN